MSYLEREVGYREAEISFFFLSLVYTLLGKINRDEIDDIGKKEQNC